MATYNPAHRHSQWDALIPISSFEEIENRAKYDSSYTVPQTPLDPKQDRTHSLVFPLGTIYQDYRSSGDFLPPQPFRSATLDSEAAFSDISHISSPSETPGTVVRPRSIHRRSISPFSDKEATPPQPSYLSRSPRTPLARTSQPFFAEKEVLPAPDEHFHPLYSHSSTSYELFPPPAYPHTSPETTFAEYGIGSPLAYSQNLAYNQALGTTSSDPEMNFFRKSRSKALQGNEHYDEPSIVSFTSRPDITSTSTFASAASTLSDEKMSLGPQDTGVVHANGETGFGFGVQDEEKQPLTIHQSSITAQISEARTQRVRAVVDAYIEPLIRSQASNGLAKSTIVLVPEVAVNLDSSSEYSSYSSSDALGIKSSSSSSSAVKQLPSDACRLLSAQEANDLLIGFPAETSLHVVRLTSPAHGAHTGHSGTDRARFGDAGSRFWQQPAVAEELDRLLRIRLVGMGLDVQDASGATALFRRAGWAERGELLMAGLPAAADAARLRNGQEGRNNGGGAAGAAGRVTSSWQIQKEEPLLPGQASVKVEVQDVCFRTENAMGLFETRLDQAVVVTIAIEI